MSLENKLKAEKGKFAICVWDPYPRMRMKDPTILQDGMEEKDAKDCAEMLNKLWYEENKDPKTLITEELALYQLNPALAQIRDLEKDYFVIDDSGLRVY